MLKEVTYFFPKKFPMLGFSVLNVHFWNTKRIKPKAAVNDIKVFLLGKLCQNISFLGHYAHFQTVGKI
jgi:hypothetical protein